MSGIKKKDHQNNHKKHFNKKWVFINVGLAIVFIAILSVGYWISVKNSQNNNINVETKKIYKTSSDAQKLVNTGKSEDALKAYDSAIAETSDTDEQISLILSKASIYQNESDYETALTYAKEAQKIKETFAVADCMANIYVQLGDNDSAISYYQKAMALLDKDGVTYSDDLEYYKTQISNLSEEE